MMVDTLALGLTYLPMKMSRNDILHNFDPAPIDTPGRNALSYVLSIYRQSLLNAANLDFVVSLPTREIPPRQVGVETVFDGAFVRIEDILDELLTWSKPTYKQRTIGVITSLSTRYQLREKVQLPDGTTLANTGKTLADEWLFKAGLQRADWAAWQSSFFTSYMLEKRPFLTWQPNDKIVSKDQEEYLYFLVNFTPLPAQIRVRLRVELEDGTEFVATLNFLKVLSLKLYSVLCVPVGFEALRLHELSQPAAANHFDVLPTTARVMAYEVWLSDGDNARLSEVRRYEIDYEAQRFERQLLFNTSMGGYDTLRLTGKAQQSLRANRATAERVELQKQGIDYSSLRVVRIDGDHTWTISTGFFRENAVAWIAYLQQILLAEELYLITQKGHVPMELVSSDLLHSEDDPDLMARTFTLRETNKERNYSAMPAQGGIADRPVCWRGREFVPLHDEWGVRNGTGRPNLLQKIYCDTGEIFRPYTIKQNLPGTEGYIDSEPKDEFLPATTPFLSDFIIKNSAFMRDNCGLNSAGSGWIIALPSGASGSETSQAEADERARARIEASDSQANANAFGTCRALCWKGIDYAPLHDAYGMRNQTKQAQKLQRIYCDNDQDYGTETKDNTPGTDGYKLPVVDLALTADTTPFVNVALSRASGFVKNNCPLPMVGTGWRIEVPANTWGSEVSQADANAKAAAYAAILDTQANANANGLCSWATVEVEGETGTGSDGNPAGTVSAPAASNGLVVYMGGNSSESLDIPFTLPDSRAWTVELHYYARNGPNNFNVLVDGVLLGTVALQTAGDFWTFAQTPAVVSVALNIAAGSHTMRLVPPGNTGGRSMLDKIRFL